MFTKHPSVTILEEDFATREMYRRELESTCDVFPCATADDALQILKHHDINVMVLEPNGLSYNQWDLLQKIKSISRSNNLPIILISTQEMYDANFKKDLAACLVKPVLPSELLLVIKDILHNIE